MDKTVHSARPGPQQRQVESWPDLRQLARRVIVSANLAVMVHASVARGLNEQENQENHG